MAIRFPKDKTIYLIDGLSIIFRSYHALKKQPLTNTSGQNTNAFVGFFRTLFSIFKQHKPQYLAVILDSKEATFRSEIYVDYKATRDAPPSDLLPQIYWIKETLQDMEILTLERVGFEADDLLASLAQKASNENWYTYILSPDKDLLQMVNEKTHILRLEKKGFQILDIDAIKETKGVWPSQICDYLSLVGDTSDNIPGVKGIGDKTACRLLEKYKSLDGIYENLDYIKPNLLKTRLQMGEKSARLSYKLIELKKELDLVKDWCELSCTTLSSKAEKHFIRHNANSLLKTLKEFLPHKLPVFGNLEQSATFHTISKIPYNPRLYHIVKTIDDTKKLLEKALKAPVVALDTETTSLNTLNTEILGLAISYQTGEGHYLPLRAAEGTFLKEKGILPIFNEFFSKNPKIIGHNLKFDWEVLRSHGFQVPKAYADTMLMAWLIDSTSSYKMDFLALKYLDGYTCISFSDIVPKGSDFSSVPITKAMEYAAEDADITLRLYEKLMPIIKKKGMHTLLFDIEMPLMEILINMEMTGICIDHKSLKETHLWIDRNRYELEQKIFKAAGKKFNILSSQQTQEILLKLNLIEKKKMDNFSTNSKNLRKLSSSSPILEHIIQYRSYKKLVNSYLNILPDLIDKSTGRIHTSFFQTGTETGRLSSYHPNLQNIPIRDEEGKKIREAFVAPVGKKLISADYSQIELVILAHLSKDPTLCENFRIGKDIHTETAMRLFKTDNATMEQRRIAKTINFGVLYKMSAFRLASELKINYKEAKSFIEYYFQTYKEVSTFFEKQISFVRKHGYSQTLLGHQRPLKGIYSKNHLERSEAERASINSVIQGSAADVVKEAMLKITKSLEKIGNPATILLQVHDELIFEAEEENLKNTCSLIQREMESAVKLIVPLKVNIKVGHSWGTMDKL